MNKKGIEEEGMHFSTNHIIIIILFVLLLALAFFVIIPRLTAGETNRTIYSFGKSILDMTTVAE